MCRKHMFLSVCLVFSMLCGMPVEAAEVNVTMEENAVDSMEEYRESAEFDEQEPMLFGKVQDIEEDEARKIEPLATTVDKGSYESNDTWQTAYPYDMVPTMKTSISYSSQLYMLGMKASGLYSSTDEDWFYVNLTAGKKYFMDIRNVGRTNCFIEVYYDAADGNRYFYSTDPSRNEKFAKKPEKYLYFTAERTCKYYIRIANGGDWSLANHNSYYFYVGPVEQTYEISNYPIGGTVLTASKYKTITLDLTDSVFPKKTSIVNLSITDKFSDGDPCTELDKYMKVFASFDGKKYSNISGTGSSTINNISGVSLGQQWTIGVKCSRNRHSGVLWHGYLNGTFNCEMAPFPGNEI